MEKHTDLYAVYQQQNTICDGTTKGILYGGTNFIGLK